MKAADRKAATKLREDRPEKGQPWFDWQKAVDNKLANVPEKDQDDFLDVVYEGVEPRP